MIQFNRLPAFSYILWSVAAIIVGIGGVHLLIDSYYFSVDNVRSVIGENKKIEPSVSSQAVAYIQSAEAKQVSDGVRKDTDNPSDPIKMLFVGDIMLDRGVLQSITKHGKGDFDFIFKHATATREADITFGNLEGPISSRGKNMGSIYSFRMKPQVAQALQKAGFDVLSIANNHAGDWGPKALEDTLSLMREQGVVMVGAGDGLEEVDKAQIFEIGQLKIGFLAFSDVGPNWLNASTTNPGVSIATSKERIIKVVSSNALCCDLLVVSFHFGEEYAPQPTGRQTDLARAAIDAGADIVAGHHPHVVQKVESYKGGIIAYSLGNFIFDQNFSKETMKGGALEIILSGSQILGYKMREVVINDKFQAIIK